MTLRQFVVTVLTRDRYMRHDSFFEHVTERLHTEREAEIARYLCRKLIRIAKYGKLVLVPHDAKILRWHRVDIVTRVDHE